MTIFMVRWLAGISTASSGDGSEIIGLFEVFLTTWS